MVTIDKYFIHVRTHCVSGNGPYGVEKAKVNEDIFSALSIPWSREKGTGLNPTLLWSNPSTTVTAE